MNGFNDSSEEEFLARMRAQGQSGARRNHPGVGDYNDPAHIEAIRPATSMPLSPGPANFPIQKGALSQPKTIEGIAKEGNSILSRILEELVRQNSSSNPVIRSKLANTTGVTLDWSQFGLFDRIMMRNAGPNTVYFSFDLNGQNVDNFTSDLSFMLQANESANFSHCKFRKIGLKCAAGTATVNAVAFQTQAGNMNGSIS